MKDEELEEIEIDIEQDDQSNDDASQQKSKKKVEDDVEVEEADDSSTKDQKDASKRKKWSEMTPDEKRKERQVKKKNKHRAVQHNYRQIDSLTAENRELKSRLDRLEQRNTQNETVQIESLIEQAEDYYDNARELYKEAAEANDADKMLKAQEGMNAARDRIGQLKNVKNRAATTKQNVQQKQTTAQKTESDPVVARQFAKWHAKNDWFDPELADEESYLAYALDARLVNEGFNPKDDEYWAELNKRLSKQFPHLVDHDEDEEDEDEDEEVQKPRMKANQQTRRSPVSQGSGRGQGAANGKVKITLSKDRVAAMRQAGLEPGTPEWNKQAKYYHNWDKAHQNR